jgi:hypothetical protein
MRRGLPEILPAGALFDRRPLLVARLKITRLRAPLAIVAKEKARRSLPGSKAFSRERAIASIVCFHTRAAESLFSWLGQLSFVRFPRRSGGSVSKRSRVRPIRQLKVFAPLPLDRSRYS